MCSCGQLGQSTEISAFKSSNFFLNQFSKSLEDQSVWRDILVRMKKHPDACEGLWCRQPYAFIVTVPGAPWTVKLCAEHAEAYKTEPKYEVTARTQKELGKAMAATWPGTRIGCSDAPHKVTNVWRTVLILDIDFAFVLWLGQLLHQAQYDAFPAKSCEDATELLNELNVGIDLLVLNFGLRGARDFATALRRSQSHLKILAAVGDGEELSALLPEADAAKKKPSSPVDYSKIEWLNTIESLLA